MMKLSRVTAAIMMASLSSPLFAGAEQSIGTVTSASQGTFVARGGKLLPIIAGQSLYAGDRIVTRDKASAKVAFQGCNVSLASTSMLAVNGSSCTTAPTSFATDDDTSTNEGATTTTGPTAEEIAIALAAAAALAAGIVAATSNSDSAPASP